VSVFRNRTVLLTGGSSGIGWEFAKLFLSDGARVILAASQAPKLEEAAASLEKACGVRPRTIAVDLSSREAVFALRDRLDAEKTTVDVLVNNAGFGLYGPFLSYDADRVRKLVDVNVQAPLLLTRLFAPGMVERGWGRVMNVASTAAFQAIPIESVYAASKAFVLLFSEALADELSGTGVAVTCLCPGPTRTPFFNSEMISSKTVTRNMMAADEVARAGYRALERGKSLQIAGAKNRTAVFLERFVPRKMVVKLARRVVE